MTTVNGKPLEVGGVWGVGAKWIEAGTVVRTLSCARPLRLLGSYVFARTRWAFLETLDGGGTTSALPTELVEVALYPRAVRS